MIKVVSAYRVSQATPSQAGEPTSCKQQVRSMLKKGIIDPNPKKAFLINLSQVIQKWRIEGENYEVILSANMNKCINTNGDLQDFCLENDLLDTVGLLNPTQINDATYLCGTKKY